jgi:hypothetical protein
MAARLFRLHCATVMYVMLLVTAPARLIANPPHPLVSAKLAAAIAWRCYPQHVCLYELWCWGGDLGGSILHVQQRQGITGIAG